MITCPTGTSRQCHTNRKGTEIYKKNKHHHNPDCENLIRLFQTKDLSVNLFQIRSDKICFRNTAHNFQSSNEINRHKPFHTDLLGSEMRIDDVAMKCETKHRFLLKSDQIRKRFTDRSKMKFDICEEHKRLARNNESTNK